MRRPRKRKKNRNKLSEHFSKKDFVCKESGTLKISLGLIGALELLRAKSKKRISILKGFQSLESAEKAGTIKRNYHTQGLAADISIESLTVQESFKLAEEIPEIKGIGINLKENYIHVDTRKAKERSVWLEVKDQEIEVTQDNREQILGASF